MHNLKNLHVEEGGRGYGGRQDFGKSKSRYFTIFYNWILDAFFFYLRKISRPGREHTLPYFACLSEVHAELTT